MKENYWNPYFEKMQMKDLKEVQFQRFKNIFTFAYNNSPAYRELYDSHNITPDDIKDFDDISKVPFVDKQFVTDSLDSSLYGKALAVDEKSILFYHQTSGTTAKPIRQPDTLEDWYSNGECWAQVLWAQGVRPEDRVMIAFNYGVFIGFWGAHYGCEKIGAEIIATGGMTSEQKINKMIELKVTTLIATPTYLYRLHEVAESKGINTRELGLKRVICAGEPGALIPSVKNELEAMWNCDAYDHIGSTEAGAWGYECQSKSFGIHVIEPMVLVEIVDFDTNEIITEPNVYGKVVITSFYRNARPCIRFNSNDIACWQEGQCSCGRTYRRLKGGIQGRFDNILKVKGTFVNPNTIEEIVVSNKSLTREYLLTIGRDKSMKLQVEAIAEIPQEDYNRLSKSICNEILNHTFLHMNVEVLPSGSIERSELKSKRVIDLRK